MRSTVSSAVAISLDASSLWGASVRGAQSSFLEVARTRSHFRKADIVRFIEAVRAAGVKVTGIEVTSDGTIRAIESAQAPTSQNDFDRYEAEL